jgi:tetratricopeptide (TPR) repeat protein
MNRILAILTLMCCLSCNAGSDYKEIFKQANIETDNENYNGAITLLNRVVKLNPDFDSAYAERAYNYYMLDKADLALINVNKALEINYNNITAYYYRALISKYLLSDFEQAIKDYTHIIRTGDTLFYKTALQLRAQTYAFTGDLSKTIADLTEIINLDSLDYEIWAERGFYKWQYDITHLYLKNGFIDYSKLPDNHKISHMLDEHNNISKTVVFDTHGAITDFSKAIEINPEFSNAYYYRSRVYFDISLVNTDVALEDINKAIDYNENSDYYVHRAAIYHHLKQPDTALEDLNTAIELNPNSGHAHFNRGQLKEHEFGDLNGARQDYGIAKRFGIQ